jgi:DNA polymerase elongation subunit (family B)
MITNKKIKEVSGITNQKTGKTGIHRYTIPDKFYTDEFRLVDIQTLRDKKVLYIFRDKNNKKVYHKENDTYIAYQCPDGVDARKIVPYEKLEQIKVPYENKYNLDSNITYEGDLRLSVKHAIDYYHNNIGEPNKDNLNIMYFDIEIDTGDNKEFPQPKEANYPINMISVIYHKNTICYVIDNKTEPIKDISGVELKIFKTEKELMLSFIKDFKNNDPDFLCGWNSISFDMEYIFNRLPKLNIKQSSMSKTGEFYNDGVRYICKLGGCVVLDQLFLYKSFTFTKKENYKLGSISLEELGVTKIELPVPMNEMYWKKLNLMIEYNIRDTELLEKLEDKLQHINLLNEIREICSTSFEGGSSPFGQIDSIMVNFLKEKGLASKNSDPHIKKEKYPGAYVLDCVPGIYDKITDFDFTSLYPSIIGTYNIGINSFVMKFKDPHDGYDFTYYPENLPEKLNVVLDPSFENKEIVVDRDKLIKKVKESNLVHTINGCFFKQHDDEMSVYSEVLTNLLSSRKTYKKKMLEAKEAGNKSDNNLYNTRQLTYKVLANSLYGVVANKSFRFFDISCASSITLGGQESLKNSIIWGESFMEHLKTNNDYIHPEPITKTEMYDKLTSRKFENLIAGDTDSIFVCFSDFKDTSTENIKINCDKIQTFLNDKIGIDIVKKHNVDLKYNKLNLKNELIIDRGLFLAKKQYAIHVIQQENKIVDEKVYMGIPIKRSDFPSKTKGFLKELLDIIFNSKKINLPTLIRYINEQRNTFMKLIQDGDKSIAKPVSYTKKLSSYKVVPQGVRAMENFNNLFYKTHNVGDRAYMFKINAINLEKAPKEIADNFQKNFVAKNRKLDVIALPDDMKKLPNFITADMKAQMKFVFEDRHALLLAPLLEVKINKENDLLKI